MIWKRVLRGSAPQSVNINELVGVNDRIQLEINGRSYLSRIEDIRGEDLYAGCPIENGKVVNVRPGTKVMLNLFLDEGLRQFETTTTGVVSSDRVPMIVVSGYKDKGRVQRRDYVRVRDKLQVCYRPEGTIGNAASWWTGATQDISAGGLHISIEPDSGITVGDFLEVDIQIPSEKPIRAIARVVRVASTIGKMIGIGVNFVQIHPVEQRRLVQYVSRKQVSQVNALKKNSGDDGLNSMVA